ncbi:MAG: tetratricopeptide repeat protein [candidate division WOR-3 bacterium]|nr:MAG: tetratricopeptide repeat protein [candidate division WOR-3 bacterium]
MQRILGYVVIGMIIHIWSCSPAAIEKTYIEKVISSQGAVIEVDGARFEFPANSVSDSTLIRFGKHVFGKRSGGQGYVIMGESYVIEPETLVFQKPITLAISDRNENIGLGATISKGFVPLANCENREKVLTAKLWHGGEYVLVKTPDRYGIVDHKRAKEGLLIVGDLYVGTYIENFKKALRKNGYDIPVWTFLYDPRQSIEDNARFLREELKRLHGEYGEFRMDVVSFGIGGLVTHRYLTDTSYYQRDISSAVIAIGTPFFGSNFADPENILKGTNPLRFFFLDGMGGNAVALVPGSEFISSVVEKKHLPGFHYYDDPTENKNFVALRGHKSMRGEFVEEMSGDGLVSIKSAMLTAIEPDVFELDHFELFENENVHKVAADFVKLYRGYSWPMLFSAVWNDRESYSKINDTWEREVKLHLRDDIDFSVLLEFNENMLNSAPRDAILVTNGDYDTYPAWYLQQSGIRSDVAIVNRSLLNIRDYARFLMRTGLPLGLSDEELDTIDHIREDGKLITISDQLMQILLRQKIRPVVFSTTIYHPDKYGYPLKLSGLVYELLESDIDVVRTKHLLLEQFTFEKLFSRSLDSLDINLQNMIRNYAAIAYQLAIALEDSGEYGEAIEMLEFAERFGIEPMFYFNEAKLYFKIGKREKAADVLEKLLVLEIGDIKLVKEVARMYHDNDMRQKAVSLLAAALEDNPEDRELTDLIRKYQEE